MYWAVILISVELSPLTYGSNVECFADMRIATTHCRCYFNYATLGPTYIYMSHLPISEYR